MLFRSKRRREGREQRQADLDVKRAARDKLNETIKAPELEQKVEVQRVTTPLEKDSTWVKVKSWFGRLVWRPRTKTAKDLEQGGMRRKETQKTAQMDSDTEFDEPTVVVQEGPGLQTWSPI